jgi:hypothetical protein
MKRFKEVELVGGIALWGFIILAAIIIIVALAK